LTLYHHNNHYDFIKAMHTFFSRTHFCHECNTAYNNMQSHRCLGTCPCCYSKPQCKENKPRLCNDCQRYFRNDTCFNKHKTVKQQRGSRISTTVQESNYSRTSICDRIQRCKKCNTHIQSAHKKKHECGYFDCRICKLYVKQEGNDCSISNDTFLMVQYFRS